MSTRNRLPRAVVTLALPLALWTALPAVQWCTLRWDQVRLECFARCERTTPAVAPCARAAGGCPLAAASGSAPCGAAESCAAHGHAAGIHATAPAQAACPLSARWAPGLKRPASPAHGRAYCLGAPNGGLALRASAPSPDPAGTISALAATDID